MGKGVCQGDLSLQQGDSTVDIQTYTMNQEMINHYFRLLCETLTTHGLMNKPSQIHNVDETGAPPNPWPPKIITTKRRMIKKV